MSDVADEVCERIAAAAREAAGDLGCVGLPEYDRIADALDRFADLVSSERRTR